ncbi:uronyl 2-sulfotransferase-like isoform X1 [Amphiura filiformis]|uniref:uronyl 2-sulfotransferase-like isoform X1 n=1 Tax=Amphiura filiformis TaxID=82378 RepID=UPI003B2253CE
MRLTIRKLCLLFVLIVTCVVINIVGNLLLNYQRRTREIGSRFILGISTESPQKLTEHKKYGVPITGLNHTIIYNKLPKCGSRTMDMLLISNAKRFHVKLDHNQVHRGYDLDVIDPKGKEEFAIKRVQQLAAHPPALFSDHVLYFPVDKSNNPVYINMIRDPIEALVSNYYYIQHGDRAVAQRTVIRNQKNMEEI